LREFTLDLADTLSVAKVWVNGRPPARFATSSAKLRITLGATVPPGAALVIVVRYSGSPRPSETLWGEVGFEELTDGALVSGQPNGAPSWFPCDDHPYAKASYRIQISTDSPYYAVANGELISRRTRATRTTWTYEQPEPTPTYLVTLQIGRYVARRLPGSTVAIRAVLPARLQTE
ncbi:M1 family peptidase, partial [Mycolicibacter sp. MYC340]|nr:M1 family peptidase [Mycolicibacter sp. MYC340]